MPSPPVSIMTRVQNKSHFMDTLLHQCSSNQCNASTSSMDMKILYIVLVHEYGSFVGRLIDSLNNQQHSQTFIVHVDKKNSSDSVYQYLINRYQYADNVYILSDNYRQSLVWGGFSIVNATLSALKYAIDELQISFDYAINLSGTTYPLKSNSQIRNVLAEIPGRVLMQVDDQPLRPHPELWGHYEECDARLHRISRLTLPRGLNLYLGSQWFALPYQIAKWMVHDDLPIAFIEYSQHTVVADETYFATMWRSSPYCDAQSASLILYANFGQWESERIKEKRDPSKCLSSDPNVCGRSPVTLLKQLDEETLIQTPHLFARKFDPNNPDSVRLLDAIDTWRYENEAI